MKVIGVHCFWLLSAFTNLILFLTIRKIFFSACIRQNRNFWLAPRLANRAKETEWTGSIRSSGRTTSKKAASRWLRKNFKEICKNGVRNFHSWRRVKYSCQICKGLLFLASESWHSPAEYPSNTPKTTFKTELNHPNCGSMSRFDHHSPLHLNAWPT